MAASQEFQLTTDDDVLRRLGGKGVVDGLSELIWNAVDADATRISVELERGHLGGVDGVSVVDDGHGISLEVATEQFARFGGSAKRTQMTSPKGRPLVGREGQGRFHAMCGPVLRSSGRA